MTSELTSQELLLRVAQGDRAAFDEVHDRFRGMVRAAATRILGRSQDVDDVCQDVFFSLWCQAGRYDPERGSPSTWIGLLARRRAVDCLRSKLHREVKTAHIGEVFAAGQKTADVTAICQESESAGRVKDVIARLPEDQRTAVSLSLLGGFKGRHIAAIQRVPHATIKTRIRRGLERMRVLMAQDAA